MVYLLLLHNSNFFVYQVQVYAYFNEV